MRAIFRDVGHQAQFVREGFVEVELLDAADCARLVDLHDRNAGAGLAPPVSFTAVHADAARRQAVSEGIREIMEPALGRVLVDCRTAAGNFFCKQPSAAESEIHLHQDWSFVDEDRHDSLTAWCPLENISNESGTLMVVPGSHRIPGGPRGYVSRFPYPDVEAVLRERYSRPVSATPGHVVLFHQRLFHWSGPNRSAARRLAANCFAAPREAALTYPHPDPEQHPGRLELFEADDVLLASFQIGRRPEGSRSLGLVAAPVPSLSDDDLVRVLGPLWVAQGTGMSS